eukprot:276830-Rhodomonas_salina.1
MLLDTVCTRAVLTEGMLLGPAGAIAAVRRSAGTAAAVLPRQRTPVPARAGPEERGGAEKSARSGGAARSSAGAGAAR